MELSVRIIVLFIAVLLTGLSAGFFYAWEVSVIQGTKLISDRSYLETMQSVNRAILNPAFFVTFIGTIFLLAAGTYLQFTNGVDRSFYMMLSATLVYIIGTFGVTVGGNVPLNESLDALNVKSTSPDELRNFRASFEGRWNQLHTIRTVFAVVSFLLSMMGVFTSRSVS